MSAMQQLEMISVCACDGALRPLRFRFADETGQLQVANIAEIVSCVEIPYVGAEALIYVCRTYDGAREHLLEIKYSVRTHKWALRRMIY